MRLPIALVFAVALTSSAAAQEMNYEAFPVGARYSLMSGAAVGGARDASAVFYNPAGSVLQEGASIGLSADIIRYKLEIAEDFLGPGTDKPTTAFTVVPSLTSLGFRFDENTAVGFGIVKTQDYSTRFRSSLRRDVPSQPGTQFTGEADLSREAEEVWLIAALSFRPTPRFAIGLAPVFAYRYQDITFRRLTQVTQGTAVVDARNSTFEAEFFQVSLFGRIGFAWDATDRLKLGATFTTPSVRFYGDGSELASTLRATGDPATDQAGDSRQEGLKTRFRHPLQLAVGAEWAVSEKYTLALALSYRDRLGSEKVMVVDEDQGFFAGAPTTVPGGTQFMEIIDKRDAVVNVALAVEYHYDKLWSIYFGFRTDRSPVDLGSARRLLQDNPPFPRSGVPLSSTDVDIYEWTIALGRKGETVQLGIGLTVGWGAGEYVSEIDYTSDATVNTGGRLSAAVDRDYDYFSLGMILSLGFQF